MASLKRKLAVLLAVCMVVMTVAPAYAEGETEPKAESTEVESVQESEDEIEISSPSVAEYGEEIVPEEENADELKDEEELEEDFFDRVVVDGVVITATAKAGVVPAGTKLSAEKVEDEDTEKAIDEVVEEKRGDKVNVAESFKFDIKLILDGEEIQPKGKLNITFSMEEAVNDNAKIDVYHIIENKETDELIKAEELKVKTENKEEEEVTEFSVETTGCSYYVVEFTLNNLQYVLNGDESVKLSIILAELEIEGTVTDAEVSNEELFTVTEDEDGKDWTVTALQAFSSEEWMKVTIDEQVYEIVVTDEQEMREVSYFENGVQKSHLAVKLYQVSIRQTITLVNDGWYYLPDGTRFDNRVVNNADVNHPAHIILGGKVEMHDGITNLAGKALCIYGTSENEGTLHADARGGYPGIGNLGRVNESAGTLTIYSGCVYAHGGSASAGIGCGIGGGKCSGGNITINGGEVYAWGRKRRSWNRRRKSG